MSKSMDNRVKKRRMVARLRAKRVKLNEIQTYHHLQSAAILLEQVFGPIAARTCSNSGAKGLTDHYFERTLVRRKGPDQFFRSSSENAYMAIRSACMGSDELFINL
jgi:hypothetical protein